MAYYVTFPCLVFFKFSALDDLPEGACAILRVKALHPGHTALTAMYTRMKLSASVLIGAYNELEVRRRVPLEKEINFLKY